MIEWRNIFDLIDAIQQRLGMFIPDKSIISLRTFLAGYEHCLVVHGMVERDVPVFKHFSGWLAWRFDWGLSYGWARAISENVRDERDPLEYFFDLVREFRKLVSETVAGVKLGPEHQPTGKQFSYGDGMLMKLPEKIEVIHYKPEQLFFLRFCYPEKVQNDTELYSSAEEAKRMIGEGFQILQEEWE